MKGLKKKIVILGAGFGGVNAAIHLSQSLKGRSEIFLVDINNYHLFKPMLHEVATGSVEPGHILQPIRHIMKGRQFTFVRGMAQRIDTGRKSVHLCEDCLVCHQQHECPIEHFNLSREDMRWRKQITLDYDYLILALGGSPNYLGIEGAQEYAFPFNRLEDAEKIRKRILHAFDIANRVRRVEKRKQILTFVIVGAGPTGLELLNDLHDWIYGALPSEFSQISQGELSLYLVEAGKDILPASPAQIRQIAKRLIKGKRIILLTGTPVIRVGKDFLETSRGLIQTFTAIWTAGIKGNDLLSGTAGLELDTFGRVVVDSYLTAQGLDHVFAIGDCSAYTPPRASHPLPSTGQVAVQEAHYLVKRLSALHTCKTIEPFRYREFGSALSAGRHQGLVNLTGLIPLSGLLGWMAWKFTYLKHLIGIRLSTRSILEWFFDITYDREATRHKF
jgi:NADH dehydrogenase